MISKLITTHNGTVIIPSYGSLSEIHKVLVDSLNWTGKTVVINGWGYLVSQQGFIPNFIEDKTEQSPSRVALVHKGMALLLGTFEADSLCPDCPLIEGYYLIVTTARIPHIIDRCQHCGTPLIPAERKKMLCDSCYGMECS